MRHLSSILSISILFCSLTAQAQNYAGRNTAGRKYAEQEVEIAKGNKSYKPFYDTLIKDRETAIAIAECLLFKIYGEKQIRKERPYECYLINGFWCISGTLPKNYLGGTFEIIMNAKNAEVVKIIHGK